MPKEIADGAPAGNGRGHEGKELVCLATLLYDEIGLVLPRVLWLAVEAHFPLGRVVVAESAALRHNEAVV